MSKICPLCLEGELKFVHINLKEDVRICMNEQCVYPFDIGVSDEFMPCKRISEKDSQSYASVAELIHKIEKDFEKDCFEWDKFANGNEFLSNIDHAAACEFVDNLDKFVENKTQDSGTSKGTLDVSNFLHSLDKVPASFKPALCEDSFITKLVQSHLGTGDAKVNNIKSGNILDQTADTADIDHINSVISELEETQGNCFENSASEIQWDAADFNADSFELKANDDTTFSPQNDSNSKPLLTSEGHIYGDMLNVASETEMHTDPFPVHYTNPKSISYPEMSLVDPCTKTIIVNCSENLPLHYQFGKHVRSVIILQPASLNKNPLINELASKKLNRETICEATVKEQTMEFPKQKDSALPNCNTNKINENVFPIGKRDSIGSLFGEKSSSFDKFDFPDLIATTKTEQMQTACNRKSDKGGNKVVTYSSTSLPVLS